MSELLNIPTSYLNKVTLATHKVTPLSNGQFLVDGYFVIDRCRLEEDFAILPETSTLGTHLKIGISHGQPFKITNGGPQPHSTKEDAKEKARNIVNVTNVNDLARINALSEMDKPIHIRVTDNSLIPDGYYAKNLVIDDVDQEDIYCFYK